MDSPKYQSTKKSSACHGGIRNNFSQSCEKRAHQVTCIVSSLIPRRCDRTNQPVFGPLKKGSLYKDLS